ncbi:hypothetical protein B0T16DRAFT_201580 [Cercophora newfieldiana]|uniref:NACHT domain-containing protein n=1 Tax=Cercophora newfieldiana TaxID=92897 RepID=A0AA39XV68_9PEZI|nr:hypothetical protein B0T16DRAFT_201580 [Cercophora newfieldiana]
MDLIFRNDAKLKPLVRLGLALSAFENSLGDARRATFQGYRDQARTCLPDLEAVRMITAEIDCQSGRPTGSRHAKILDAAQRIAALGDVMVGGSQNLVACGVWATLRLTLVTLGAINSYRENASKLFMEIGRSAPRHDALTVLYPQSKRLQDAVWEYFIIVVQLCQNLLQNSTKNRLRALATAVFADHALKAMKHDLAEWAQAIDREVAYSLSESVNKGAKAKSLSRITAGFSTEAKEKRRRSEKRLEWLKACSEYQHEPAWARLRKEGNATFFLQESSFRRFKARQSSSTLLCTGRLGSGKSVLMANMVDDLVLSNQAREYTTAYFFVRSNDVRSITARAVFGSLARQILEFVQDSSWVNSLPDGPPGALGLDDIVALLRQILPPSQFIFIVLDGLDDCENNEKMMLMGHIRELQRLFNIHLSVSMRLEANRNKWKEFDRLDPDFILEIPQNNPDISSFVRLELEALLESGDLSVGDPSLVQEIQHALIRGSKGMFLWVSLQLQTICLERTDQDIRDALRSLPDDLPGVYESILARCRKFGERYQLRILKLLAAAFKPLTAEDLRQCLSVVPGEISWAQDGMINDIFSTLACCGGLVVVDEQDLTIHLVHPSVRQFLLGNMSGSSPSDWRFSLEDAHREMTGVMVTYIHSFESRGTVTLHQDAAPAASLLPNPEAVIKSTKMAVPNGSSKTVIQIVSKLSRLKQGSKNRSPAAVDVSKVAEDLSRRPPGTEDEFTFLPYAKEYWLLHSITITPQDIKVYALWEALTELKGYGNCFQWPNIIQRLALAYPKIGMDGLRKLELQAPEIMVWAIITSNHVLLDSRLHRYRRRLRLLRDCCRTIMAMEPLPVIDGKMANRLLTVSILMGFQDPTFLGWLILNQPDPSYGGYGSIYAAMLVGKPGVARMLLEGLSVAEQPLYSSKLPLVAEAVELGDTKSLRMLLRRGANIWLRRGDTSPIELAISRLALDKNNHWVEVAKHTPKRLMAVYLLLKGGAKTTQLPKNWRPMLVSAAKMFAASTNRGFFDFLAHTQLKESDVKEFAVGKQGACGVVVIGALLAVWCVSGLFHLAERVAENVALPSETTKASEPMTVVPGFLLVFGVWLVYYGYRLPTAAGVRVKVGITVSAALFFCFLVLFTPAVWSLGSLLLGGAFLSGFGHFIRALPFACCLLGGFWLMGRR